MFHRELPQWFGEDGDHLQRRWRLHVGDSLHVRLKPMRGRQQVLGGLHRRLVRGRHVLRRDGSLPVRKSQRRPVPEQHPVHEYILRRQRVLLERL